MEVRRQADGEGGQGNNDKGLYNGSRNWVEWTSLLVVISNTKPVESKLSE